MRRRDFAPTAVVVEMGKQPWTHQNCIFVTEKLFGKGRGIARPGKTAFERVRRANKAG